jgi:hypothetical protein
VSRACPLCERPLFAWVALPIAPNAATVGLPLADDPSRERVLERCESCGVALERDREVELGDEWAAICRAGPDGGREIAIPNRASLQAGIGVDGWAAIDLHSGRLLHTPRSLALLAERNGCGLESPHYPRFGRNQAWMWQTLLNGLTLQPNFARQVRAGGFRPRGGRGRAAFAVDLIVTALAAPLVALVSVPLELFAALARRGGELRARVLESA